LGVWLQPAYHPTSHLSMYIQSLGRILQRKMGLSKCHSDLTPSDK
jgi:hypothetical protein